MSTQLKVLFIEDSEDDVLLLTRRLNQHGYEVLNQRISREEELHQALAGAAWDMVICDYSLPGFDLHLALRIVRDHDPDMPFIIVSGAISDEMAVSAMKAGAQDYIMKDNLSRLAPAVEREIRETATRRERRQAREELDRQHRTLQVLLDNLPAGVAMLEIPSGRTLLYNRQAAGMLGEELLTKDRLLEFTSRTGARVFGGGPPYPMDRTPLFGAGEGRAGKIDDLEMPGPNGETRVLEITGAPVFDAGGRVWAAVAVFQDITLRREAEAERLKLENQLRQAQKMEAVGTLAGGIAHDFNNILQAINGYTEILLLDKPADGARGCYELGRISNACERASGLVKQLLTFSRRLENDLRLVDLNQEVGDLGALLARALPKSIHLAVETDPRLSPVRADPSQMEQLMMNLALNARDAMPAGGNLTIRTREIAFSGGDPRHPGVPPGDWVVLSVSDTGHGMDSQTLEHVFEPFFTTKETGKGTGLGLSMAYGIVESHGGYINCRSKPGLGATFLVYLPAQRSAAPKETPGASELPTPGRGEKIMVVDDDDAVRDLTASSLSRHGYRVIQAASGEEALEAFQTLGHNLDLILLDLGMPGMGGKKFLLEINKLNPSAKVLVASGYLPDPELTSELAHLAAGFVAKPFKMTALLEAVGEVLG